jgi:hypothetical protein
LGIIFIVVVQVKDRGIMAQHALAGHIIKELFIFSFVLGVLIYLLRYLFQPHEDNMKVRVFIKKIFRHLRRYSFQFHKDNRTLKELIERHITSSGTGFEIDDIISGGAFSNEVVNAIYDIDRRYRTEIYKMGSSNPASFAELQKLADKESA